MLQISFLSNPLHMKFSHSQMVSKCSIPSLSFYQGEMHLDYGQWTVILIFSWTFRNLYSPIQVVDYTYMSYLGYAFLLGRIHCRKLWFRSLYYFNTDIVLCFHSIIFSWHSDFSSYFAVKLTTEIIIFQKDTSTELLKTVCIISGTTLFISY